MRSRAEAAGQLAAGRTYVVERLCAKARMDGQAGAHIGTIIWWANDRAEDGDATQLEAEARLAVLVAPKGELALVAVAAHQVGRYHLCQRDR